MRTHHRPRRVSEPRDEEDGVSARAATDERLYREVHDAASRQVAAARIEYRCTVCKFGAIAATEPPFCPVCRSSSWTVVRTRRRRESPVA
jgi:rubrerythrin